MAICKGCGVKVTEFYSGMYEGYCNDCSIKITEQIQQESKESNTDNLVTEVELNNDENDIQPCSHFDERPEGIAKYFSLKGRSSRSEFLIIKAIVLFTSFISTEMYVLLGLLLLPAILVVEVSATVRRFHDVGRSGSQYWTLLIPIYNFYITLVLFFEKSDEGDNKYGRDPLAYQYETQVDTSTEAVEISATVDQTNVAPNINVNEKSIADEERLISNLERLASLKNTGALTEEEFEQRKKALLSQK